MPEHDVREVTRDKSHLLRQVARQPKKEAETPGVAPFKRNAMDQVVCRLGDASCATAHASRLSRATVSQPPQSANSLLNLQRSYGNRYVQRVVALSRQGDGETEVAPEVEEAIQAARGGGQALDSAVRARMEPAFGADFGGVRVHSDAQADTLNRSLNARAFTTGQDIFFRQGEYSPGNSIGHELLAHELTHVMQQNGESVQRKLTVGAPGDRYEQEADRVSQAMAQLGQPAVQQQAIQRLLPQEEEDGKEPVRAKSTPAQLQLEGESGSPRLRLPTLEVFSAQQGGAFAGRGRSLVGNELSDAASIFGSSVNLDVVRIVETPIVNAPTTLGNYIRVAPGYTMAPSTLIHELAHVWQFQTKGTAYISDSIWHQVAGAISTGSRGAAYAVTIVPGQSIHEYTAEQQAVIIENYYAVPALRNDPEYQRLIAEVRRAHPIAMSTILDEAVYGPGAETERLRSITGREPEPFMGGGNIPQIRIEF